MAVGTLARAELATWTGTGGSVCQKLVPCALTIMFVAAGLLVCLVGDKILLIPEFCPGGQRLTCGQTLSTNQMCPWD